MKTSINVLQLKFITEWMPQCLKLLLWKSLLRDKAWGIQKAEVIYSNFSSRSQRKGKLSPREFEVRGRRGFQAKFLWTLCCNLKFMQNLALMAYSSHQEAYWLLCLGTQLNPTGNSLDLERPWKAHVIQGFVSGPVNGRWGKLEGEGPHGRSLDLQSHGLEEVGVIPAPSSFFAPWLKVWVALLCKMLLPWCVASSQAQSNRDNQSQSAQLQLE